MDEAALARLAEDFRRDGFVHVPGALDPAEVETLGAAVDHAVAARKRNDARTLDEKSPYEQSFIQCQYLWEDFPDVGALTFHPVVGQIAGALLGAERVRLWHDQALYKEAGGRETDPHQDHPYWPINEHRTLTVWIPLAAVDEATGCMGYVPGSHLGAVEFTDIFTKSGAGQDLVARQAAKPVFKPVQPGDLLFHDGRTVHMAHPNRSAQTRRAYTAIYFADGCTRAPGLRHPSVDRTGISVGAVIDGPATPVTWPLPGGQLPTPGPWPESDHPRAEASRRLGIVPGAAV
jgi:hypothetical protein